MGEYVLLLNSAQSFLSCRQSRHSIEQAKCRVRIAAENNRNPKVFHIRAKKKSAIVVDGIVKFCSHVVPEKRQLPALFV